MHMYAMYNAHSIYIYILSYKAVQNMQNIPLVIKINLR